MSRRAGSAGLPGDRGLQPAGRPGSTGCPHSRAGGGEGVTWMSLTQTDDCFTHYTALKNKCTIVPRADSMSGWTIKDISFCIYSVLCFPDRVPDQESGAGPRTWLYLPGPEGRGSADHPLRQLHKTRTHRLRPCGHGEGTALSHR